SFFVVALPHILPCPAPRKTLADGELDPSSSPQKRKRRPKQQSEIVGEDGVARFNNVTVTTPEQQEELQRVRRERRAERAERGKRECPVPKPGGVLGEWLGFHKDTTAVDKGELKRGMRGGSDGGGRT
ncbi:hypothetical protein B0T21DRAFT_368567, partial [Apiosordaria backusii]